LLSLPVVAEALVHGLSFLMPVGENMHVAVLTRLFGWPLQSLSLHIACHAGGVLALLLLLHRELGRIALGAWQLAGGRWRPEAARFASLVLALLPIGALRVMGLPAYVSTFGLGRVDYVALTGLAAATLLWLADRYSLAIRRLEHLSPVDGVVLGVGQLAIFFPGVGFIPVTIMLARLLGFERAHAARIAFLLALPAFAGEVLLSGSQLYREGALAPAGELVVSAVVSLIAALIAGGIVLAWLRRHSLLPFALYRLLASAGALLWWYFVFRG